MKKRLWEVRKAKEIGVGVFASEDLDGGTNLFSYSGSPRWIWDIPRWAWDHCFQVGYDRYVIPRPGSAGWSINHSCSPNCWIDGARGIQTMRRVRKGEELTFDYSTNVGWPDYSMLCERREAKCRRVIACYSKLSDELKRRYEGHVSPYLLKPPRKFRPSLF